MLTDVENRKISQIFERFGLKVSPDAADWKAGVHTPRFAAGFFIVGKTALLRRMRFI